MESFDDADALQYSGSEGTLAPESFWAWQQDRHFRYRHVIPVAAAPTFDPRLCVGRSPWELPGSRPLAGSWAEHRHRLASRLPFQNFRYLVAAGNGQARCLCESGMPHYDEAGDFTGYRGTTRDVTQQWLQECRLQETEDLLQATAAVARFGSWSYDVATGQVTWSRQALARREGAGAACTVPAQELLQRYSAEDDALLRAACRRCIVTGTPFDLEVQCRTANGGRKWLRVIGVAARGPRGDVARVQGAFQDIHRSKAAVQAQRRTQEHLRVTLDSLTDGFLTLDRQWRIVYVNPAAEAILGIPVHTLVGQLMWDAFPGAEHGIFGQRYREAMGEGRVVRFEAEYPPLSMWVRVSAFPSPQGLAISFTDITAARQACERLLQDKADLEQRVRARTDDLLRVNEELECFTQAVANDLRSPLAHIEGFARVLAERLPGNADPQLHHFADRVRFGVARMEGLIADLLELAHIGGSELQPRRVDLSALAREAAQALWSRQPGWPGQVDIQPGLQAWGDPRLLHTLLAHLLANAWKSGAGHPPTRIVVGQREDGAYYVQDNGPACDALRAAELFARSCRADAGAGGMRIGLAIARRVVERHGGRIWAETGPEAATVFCFRLPGDPGRAGFPPARE